MGSFYTNVAKNGNVLLVRGYHDGKRFKERVPYKPYLFLPSKEKTDYKNLQGQFVNKRQAQQRTATIDAATRHLSAPEC